MGVCLFWHTPFCYIKVAALAAVPAPARAAARILKTSAMTFHQLIFFITFEF